MPITAKPGAAAFSGSIVRLANLIEESIDYSIGASLHRCPKDLSIAPPKSLVRPFELLQPRVHGDSQQHRDRLEAKRETSGLQYPGKKIAW
jgi:hypothetical protein